MAQLSDLTPEQAKRLERFAADNGADWKDKLKLAWWTGSDANHDEGYLLRQIRNQHGPRWLDQFALETAVY